MAGTSSMIGFDLPSVSHIVNSDVNLTPESMELKKNQLKIKLQIGEISISQFNQSIQELESKPLYSTNTIIPDNINSLLLNPKSLKSDLIRNVVSIKPRFLPKATAEAATGIIKIVGIDKNKINEEFFTKSFSPRLINWIEPYDVKGFNKSLFYTEVNSGLKAGDRVFIINGNYDSDILIKIDKYKKGRDGYKVLEVENCKVVLDIPYTGVKPYKEEPYDNFIKVFYVRDKTEFIQVNKEITTRAGVLDYKFNFYQNTIAYFDDVYLPLSSGWGNSSGVFSPGFYVRDGSATPPTWTNITTQFLAGSFSVALSPTYSNNQRVKVMNGSFEYNGVPYREGFIYQYEVGPTQSQWVVDPTYNKPFLTKANFRDGNFDGKWNTGLFGRQDKRIIWDGEKSTWSAGTLLNTYWKKGILNSLYLLKESFFAGIDEYGLAFQKANLPNNNGKGFNFIVDSFLESSTIINGSIINTVFGSQSATFSAVENYLISATTSYPNKVIKGYFELCNFNNTYITSAEISNCRSFNSQFSTIKSINSKFKESVIKDSSYISDNIIKITDYDEWNANEFKPYNGASNKIFKFYISKESFERLKNKDAFYIKGLNITDNTPDVLNFFDKKFTLSSWNEYSDEFSNISYQFYKRPVEYVAYLSSPLENEYKINTVGTGTSFSTSIISLNEKGTYSVDIILKTVDTTGAAIDGYNFNRDTNVSNTATMSNSLGNILDISKAYIVDSDFDSGIVETSNWFYGDNINFNNELNITQPTNVGGRYNMSISSTSSSIISVNTTYNNTYPESDETVTQVGNVVFLNSVYYRVDNYIDGLIIGTQGSSYITASGVTVSGTSSGQGLVLDIFANGGTISSISISQPGVSYSVGDVLTILSGSYDATVIVTSVTSSITLLPTDYKIITNDGSGGLELQEIINPATSSIFSSLKLGGYFYTPEAQNRYGYLHKSKFHKTKIKSGIFRRSFFVNSLLETDEFDSLDKDFTDLTKIRNLVISDSIFKDNNNILSKGTYINSHFIKGNNTWTNGIIQNSVWNGPTFSNGVIKESRWVDGLFLSGIFYNSNTFNAEPSTDERFYYVENTLSYYKDGLTTATISNDRKSWQNGQFKLGMRNKPSEFYKSDWENGTFQSGKFYNSKWYNGLFVDGIFGDTSLGVDDTIFYNGTVSNVIVENGSFYASDTSWEQSTKNVITWYNGIFNDGLFATNFQQYTASNTATWHTGEFNGGEFASLAKWKNGKFNGGKFTSGYGWTQSTSATSSTYGWEYGVFTGGEFGTSDLATNSMWWDGEFDGGIFKGRVWNYGIMKGGEFQGGATWSSVGGLSSSNAKQFVDAYKNKFYGLWRDGYFTDQKDKVVKNIKLWTEPVREDFAALRKSYKPTKISNSLWLNGTFSHQSGEARNIVWLNGTYEKGKFIESSFNPYVVRNPDTKNVWQFNYLPELLYNGNFTSSNGGWVTASGFDGVAAYSTFSIVSNQGYFIADFDAPGLFFTNSQTNLTSGQYQVEFDIITFSSPYNNITLSVKVGSTIFNLIQQMNETNLGNNQFIVNLPSGSFSIYADPDGQGGSFVIDNLSVKKSPTASFNISDTCIWKDGYFDNGDFYISNWEKGTFIIGTGYGMIWQNGTTNYMNAFNIFWENGLWRNGNWYGSAFEYDGSVDDDFARQILFRGMSWSATSSCHFWNIFEQRQIGVNFSQTASSPYTDGSVETPIPIPSVIPLP